MLQTHVTITEPGDYFSSVSDEDKTDKGHPAVEGRFWRQAQPDVQASQLKDEVVHRHVIIIDRRLISDKDMTSSKVTVDNFKQWQERFPEAWLDFIKRDEKTQTGTPLEEVLEDLSPDFAQRLFIAGIRSAEELIEAPNSLCELVGLGTKKLRDALAEELRPKSKSKSKSKKG